MPCERSKEFMLAMRGIPAHHVTQALNELTPGINWARCSKAHMAEECCCRVYQRMARVDIQRVARMALARAEGERDWRNTK